MRSQIPVRKKTGPAPAKRVDYKPRKRNSFYRLLAGVEKLEDRRLLAIWPAGGNPDIPDGTVWASGEIQQIVGDIRVPAGSTLTIEPGAIVKVNQFAGIDIVVEGKILANGTAALPVVFTSLRDDSGLDGVLATADDQDTDGNGSTNGSNGDWNSIQLVAGSSGHVLDHVQVRFGGAGSTGSLVAAVPMTLTNSVIRNSSSAAVRLQTSNSTLTTNVFKDNTLAAISMDLASDPTITGVTVTGNGSNALVLDAGTVVGNGFWNDKDIVYRTSGDITLPAGSELTVGAGQIVKFRTFFGDDLLVDGKLIADATPTLPIIFTSDRDDTAGGDTNNNGVTTGNNGDWNSIQLGTGSSGHVLDNVEIRYGGAGGSASLIASVPMSLTNSKIQNSSTSGVRLQTSNSTLTTNIFANNSAAAISMDLASNPVITGVTMDKNGANALTLDSGTMVDDGFWDDKDIIFRLTGDVTVPVGKSLTIGAGQIVKFRTFFGDDLLVDGTLIAVGTPTLPIIFTSDRDDTAGGDTNNNGETVGNNGDWNSISLSTGSSGHLLDNIQIRYGGAGSSAALVSSVSMTFTNSKIINSSSSGVRLQTSDSTLNSNTFQNNSVAAISMDLASNPAINGVSISQNGVNALILDSGNLVGNQMWDDKDIVYRLTGGITVPAGQTLTIGAGQIVKSRTFFGDDLIVNGRLLVNGAAGAPVIFTSDRDDSVGGDTNNDGATVGNNGDWNAIQLAGGSGHNLNNFEVRFGGAGNFASIVTMVPVVLSNGLVTKSNTAGLRVQGATATVTNVELDGNAGAAISLSTTGDVESSGVKATGNAANASVVDGGTLASSVTWIGGDLAYQLGGNLTLSAGANLTIGANAVFEAFENVSLLGLGTIRNEGSIRKSTGTGTATIEPLILNTGTVKIVTGTLNLSGGVSNDANGVLTGPIGSTIAIGNNLSGNTGNAASFAPLATVLFDGKGTAAAPQLMEALSADRGDVGVGYDHNLSFYSLALSNNTYVKLVDSVSNVPGNGSEAVYVNNLTVPSGATLDLNGLHLYARTALLNGTIKGGSVSMVPDGGPLGLDTVASGSISAVGELDDWTIFGRAGQTLTVTVSTGAAGTTPPDTPNLGFAQVELFDPNNNLVGTAKNTASGTDVTLAGIALPSDGTYHIRLRAPVAQPNSTGNYVITAWNATVNVSPLVLHQPVFGKIDTPFRADRWTFSAAAGQVLNFNLLNAENPNIQFDLTGPNGFTAFSNRNSSASNLTLPATGTYAFTVHTAQRQTGAYAFRLDSVSVITLALGTPFSANLAAGGSAQSQLFTVSVPTSQQLQVTLTDTVSNDSNEVYAKFGSAPTRTDFQYKFSSPAAANQIVNVAAAAPGDWYILVYSETGQTPGKITLQVQGAPLFLSDVTPDHAGNGAAMSLTLAGIGFDDTAIVNLISSSNVKIKAATSRTDLPTQITATFAAGAVPAGTYDVEVTKAGGGESTLIDAFRVVQGGQANLVTSVILPEAIGYHIATVLYVEYSNTGDLAMPAPILSLTPTQTHADGSVTAGAFLTLDPSLQVEGFWTSATPQGFSHSVEFLASGATPGVLQPGETAQVPVYYAGWEQPWDFSYPPFDFTVGVLQADDTSPIDWAAQQEALRPEGLAADVWAGVYGTLVARMGNTAGQYVTQLGEDSAYLATLGERVTDLDDLWGFEIQQAFGASPFSTLASGTDSVTPEPGLSLLFERSFPSSLTGRQRLGRLGRGWTDSWDKSLSVEADGTVIIQGMNESVRTFQPDTRRVGAYFSQTGDSGVLTAVGSGVFLLKEPEGSKLKFRSDGNIEYFEDVNGNRLTAGYTGTLMTSVTHSNDKKLLLGYNSAGRINKLTDSAGRITTYAYDSTNEHLVSVTDFTGQIVRYAYDTGSNAAVRHALVSIQSPNGSRQFITYDSRGRVTALNRDGNAEQSTIAYAHGSVTVTNAAGGNITSYFDHRGLVLKAKNTFGAFTYYTYDTDYNLTQVIDPAGQVSTAAYNTNGQLIRTSDAAGRVNQYEFNGPVNHLSAFVDAKGSTTQYAYDSRGNLVATTYPDGTVERQSQDAVGNRTSWTNRRGQATQYTYDAEGRVTSKVLQDGTRTDLVYDARGNLTSITDPSGKVTFTYDVGDRPTQITYANGKFVKFTYDAFGRRTQLVDQGGFAVNYASDALGRLSKLTNAQGQTIVSYTYDTAGRLIQQTNGNGTSASYTYNAVGQVTQLINASESGTVQSRFGYTFDVLGRKSTMTTLDGEWVYAYDAVGQLVRSIFTPNSSSAIAAQDLQYVYDAAGNRVRTVINGVTTNYITDAMNEYTQIGSTKYNYDADGNLISETGTGSTSTFTYDSQNRLTGMSTPTGVSTFLYDALDNRAASIQNGVRTDYLIDPLGIGAVFAEYKSGSLTANYTYGLGLTSRVDSANSASYFQFDTTGNTAALTNSAGAVVNRYAYRPFGELLQSVAGTANPFTFSGKYGVSADPNGWYFMRARDYDSRTGQFTSNDPLELAGGDTNIRRYAANDPVNGIDPTGLGKFGKEGLFWFVPNHIWVIYPLLSLNYMEPVHEEFFYDHAVAGPSGAVINEGFGGEKFQDHTAYTMDDEYFDDRIMAQAIYEVKREAIYGTGPGYTFLTFFGIFGGNCQSLAERSRTRYWEIIARGVEEHKQTLANFKTFKLGSRNNAASKDPNEKTGPKGFGTSGFITRDKVFPYRIDFENDKDATAPAQRVTITDQLNTNLDLKTFELAELGFGDTIVTVPAGSQYYQTTVSMTYNSKTFDVQIEAGLRPQTGEVFAIFQSIEPNTQLPPDVLTGFLPPEDKTGRGMGHVSYTVLPKSSLKTGTQIRNVALITFDANPAISTDQIDPHDPGKGIDPAKQALVTIDAAAPTSQVAVLPADSSTKFKLSWSGNDDAGGSGIASYDIFMSDNNGAFTLFLPGTTETSTVFQGVANHTYKFYSVATDNVGLREPGPAQPDAQTETSLVVDFGDAPDPKIATLVANDGPQHVIGNLRLGASVTGEADGQPTAAADGDGASDDGVSFVTALISHPTVATKSSVRVVTTANAKLDAWIDFNGNGVFDQPAEHLGGGTSIELKSGTNFVSIDIPAGAKAEDTYARFRLSTAGELTPTGLASDGEVEDYLMTIVNGSSTTKLEVAASSGETQLAIEGTDIVIRKGDVVIFKGPLTGIGEVDLHGDTSDDLFKVSVPLSLASKKLVLDGGSGKDRLELASSSETLNLTDAMKTVRNIEIIDVRGTAGNTLIASVAGVKAISPTSDTLEVDSDNDDTLTFGSGWRADLPRIINGQFTHIISEDVVGGTGLIEVRNNRFMQNPLNRYDVDRDGFIRPLDALQIINAVRRRGNGPFVLPTTEDKISKYYYDVTGTNDLTPLEALLVMNAIRRRVPGTGESPIINASTPPIGVDLAKDPEPDALTFIDSAPRLQQSLSSLVETRSAIANDSASNQLDAVVPISNQPVIQPASGRSTPQTQYSRPQTAVEIDAVDELFAELAQEDDVENLFGKFQRVSF